MSTMARLEVIQELLLNGDNLSAALHACLDNVEIALGAFDGEDFSRIVEAVTEMQMTLQAAVLYTTMGGRHTNG